MEHKLEAEIGGRTLSIRTGAVARQAGGSVLVQYGDTVVLATACAAPEPRENIPFLPLTADYREHYSAGGKIPGGFFKREGRPTEKETLTARLIDRPIRPLFPEGYAHETQVISFVMSADGENNPDVLGITGVGTSLFISEIPFHQPVAAVRMGLLESGPVVNPTYSQLEDSRLNLVVVGTDDAIAMVEASAKEVSEDEIVEALDQGHQAIRQIIAMQKKLHQELSPTKFEVPVPVLDEELQNLVNERCTQSLLDALKVEGKLASNKAVDQVKKDLVESFPEEEEEKRQAAKKCFGTLKEKVFREEILQNRKRLDGRDFDQVRSLSSTVGVLPRVHGSALFTRGETQAMVMVTLGTSDDVQRIDDLEGESEKRFMLHYNFPPFSVGEVKFLRGPGRREIGHGVLAERALTYSLPGEEDFPYVIRAVSDILESNGSSSMASVCGGSLALMDAGVPVKSAVAGVAMGLVKEGSNYAILTDIAGAEDHYGDMDFKVAGTDSGITALQMDIKIGGISMQIMKEALAQARRGRLEILDHMKETIGAPRDNISKYAPRILTITVPTDKIRDIIGPGGKMIRSIIERTGVKIDVEDDGTVHVASSDEDAAKKALAIIEELIAEPEMNKVYLGKVVRLEDFGAFVQILPGKDGLLPISEIAEHHVTDIRNELREGEELLVKVISIDHLGRVRVSRRAVNEDTPRTNRPPRSGGGGGRGRGGPRGGGGGGRGGPRGGGRDRRR